MKDLLQNRITISSLTITAIAIGIVFALFVALEPRTETRGHQLAPRMSAVPEESASTGTPKRVRQNDAPQINNVAIPPTPPNTPIDWQAIANRTQTTPKLSPIDLNTCHHGIFTKGLSPDIRNNLANALVGQQPPNPNLHLDFIAMMGDQQEDPTWRIYCIQFAALCYPFAKSPERITEALTHTLDHPDGDFVGTAMMQLYRLHEEEDLALPPSYWPTVLVATSATDLSLRSTALSLLASNPTYVPRKFWLDLLDSPPEQKRFAIVALGRAGSRDDLARLQHLSRTPDSRIRMSARAAVKELSLSLSGATP